MENIVRKIEERYGSTLPYSFKIVKTETDLENPDYLENLKNSAFFSFLEGDILFCENILELFINLSYDGNSEKWTWIEQGIGLKMYLLLQNNNYGDYNKFKETIYSKFEYIGLPESTRRINLKAFTRRIAGSSLQIVKDKINKYNDEKDFQLEFMYSISYFSELIFIYSMNEGKVEENIKNELDFTKSRLIYIIDYYKSNP